MLLIQTISPSNNRFSHLLMRRELFRRYSQFHELMTTLSSEFKEVKKIPFPPKVTFGNLAASVVGNRREQLGEWLARILVMPGVGTCSELLAFLEAREGVVTAGIRLPDLMFTDINGGTVHTACYYSSHIVLVAAASRYNFQKMTQWLEPAQLALAEKYPSVKLLAVSIADLRPVPAAMRGMVTKVLKKVEKKQSAMSAKSRGAGKTWSAQETKLCIDWSGDMLKAIGAEDANWTYRLSLVVDGVVQESFQSSTNNVSAKYTAAFERILQARHMLNKTAQRVASLPLLHL